MIALLLTLPFADVTATAVADRPAIRLSESVHLTLTVEGPAPLAVTVPDEWLAAESAASWRARAVGPATVSARADGRECWTLTLRIDPYATGDPLPLPLNGVTVRSGTDPTPRRVEWPIPTIRVTSDVTSVSAEDARPVTGIESVPSPIRTFAWVWLAVGSFVLAVALASVLRRRARPSIGLTDVDTRARFVQDIESESDPRELARLVARAVRHSLGPEFVFRTTSEVRRNDDSRTSDLTHAATLLEQCDRVHFDPAAAAEADDLRSLALVWLRSR